MISQKQGHTSGAFKGPQTFHKALAIKESHNCSEILEIFSLKERVKWLDPTKELCYTNCNLIVFKGTRVTLKSLHCPGPYHSFFFFSSLLVVISTVG